VKKAIRFISTSILCFVLLFVIVSCAGTGTTDTNTNNIDNPTTNITGNVDESTNTIDTSNPVEDEYFTITFKDYDGSILQTSSVKKGEMPEYEKEEPVREEDDDYSYKFNGWNPTISLVDGEATYTATYLEKELDIDVKRYKKMLKANETIDNLKGKSFTAKIGEDTYLVNNNFLQKNDTIYEPSANGYYVYTPEDILEKTYIKIETKDKSFANISVGRWNNIFSIADEIRLSRVTTESAYVTKSGFSVPEYEMSYTKNGFVFANEENSIEFFDIGNTEVNIPTKIINEDQYVIKNEKIDLISIKTIFDIWFNNTSIIYEKNGTYVENVVSIDITDSGIVLYVVANELNNSSPILCSITFNDSKLNNIFINKSETKYVDLENKLSKITGSQIIIQDIMTIDKNSSKNDMNIRAKYVLENDGKDSNVIWAFENFGKNVSNGSGYTYKMICFTTEGICYEYDVECKGKDSKQEEFIGTKKKQYNILIENCNLYDENDLISEIILNENASIGGSVIGAGTYKYGDQVTISVSNIRDGFKFAGWYKNNRLYSEYESFDFIVGLSSTIFEARYDIDQISPPKFTITIDNKTKDVTILGVTSGEEYEYDSLMNLTASHEEGIKVTWEFNNESLITGDTYSFKVPLKNVVITITSKQIYKKTNSRIEFGRYPQNQLMYETSTLEKLNNSYPFNLETWTDCQYYISNSVSSYMYYIDVDMDLDGENDYRGVYFTKYRPSSTSDTSSSANSYQDNNGYKTNQVYWFEYNKIYWNIFDDSDGKYLIMTSYIIDSQDYYSNTQNSTFSHNGGTGYSSNYALSNIRKWLNDNFYNTAFNEYQKELIQITNVDNSLTSEDLKKFACNNTNDKMFIFSSNDAKQYYNKSNIAFVAETTQYARSQGAYMAPVSTSYYRNGHWWLRTPKNANEVGVIMGETNYQYTAGYTDYMYTKYTNSTYIGVRPACWINKM